MLLAELFQRLPEDWGHLPVPNIPSFDPRYSKVVGKFDGYDIWGSREFQGYDTFGIRDSDGVVLSTCRIESTASFGTHKLKELWTSPTHRGKGLATILVLFLLRKIRVNLLLAHDEVLSDDARSTIMKGLVAQKFRATDPECEALTIDQVKVMFAKLGPTKDSLILTETKLNFELFSDTKIDSLSTWYFVRGMNQDLD